MQWFYKCKNKNRNIQVKLDTQQKCTMKDATAESNYVNNLIAPGIRLSVLKGVTVNFSFGPRHAVFLRIAALQIYR